MKVVLDYEGVTVMYVYQLRCLGVVIKTFSNRKDAVKFRSALLSSMGLLSRKVFVNGCIPEIVLHKFKVD